MSYCANCGDEFASDAKFCKTCGKPVGVAASGTAQEVLATAQSRAGQQAGAGQAGAGQPGASQPVQTSVGTVSRAASPFAALPVGDYVRDGVAAAALIASLFMVWQYDLGGGSAGDSIAATRVDVILITLLSLVSLGIPYLWRAGVFGAGWNYAKTQDARILANVPYFAMVIVYLVIAMVVSAASEQVTTFVLGPAVAFGLAGALLAAQPRRAELAPGDVRRDKRWVAVALGLAALVVLFTIVQIIELLLHSSLSENASNDLGSLLILIVMGLASAAILAAVAMGVARSENSWRIVGIGLGIAAAVLGLLSLSPQITLVQARFDGGVPAFSLVFWLAFGAVVAAPSVARLTRPVVSGATSWLDAVHPLLAVAIGLNALVAVVSIIALIRTFLAGAAYSAFFSPVPWVVALFFGVIGVVGGLVARAMFAKGSRQGHVLATGYAGLLFVLGLVLVILWSVQGLGGISPLTMLIAFVLPVGLVVLLWGSESVRRHFADLPAAGGPAETGFSFDGVGTPGGTGPVQPASAQSADPIGPGADLDAVRAEAASPATSALRLREIASTIPEARAAVASNPTAYPDLLTWLGNLGDPDVDAALARRPG